MTGTAGDATLIQTLNGQDTLIDGGPDPQKVNLNRNLKANWIFYTSQHIHG